MKKPDRCFIIPDLRSGGFTLVEVVVTITVLAISLTAVLQLFSMGLRASRTSCDYTTAVIYAKQKMEELSVEPVQGTGKFEEKFEWQTEVVPYEEIEKAPEDTDYNILKLKVKITWEEASNRKKSIEMVSLKTVEIEK